MLQRLQNLMAIADTDEVYQLRNDALDACSLIQFFEIKAAPPEVLKNLPFHMYWKDYNGLYLGCNDTQAKSDGMQSGTQLLAKTDFDACLEENAEELRQNDLEVMRTKQSKFIPEKSTLKNGTSYHGWSYKWPLFSKKNKVIGLLGISFNNLICTPAPIIQAQKHKNGTPTTREKECLYYLAKGYAIKSIGKTLNISHRTVQHHIDSAKEKMHCNSREQLIAKTWQINDIKQRLNQEFI